MGELRVAIQGLGHVGFYLAKLLREAGASVYGADINPVNLNRAVKSLGVIPVANEDILGMEVDVLAPCAMGAILNAQTIPQLRAGIVAGAANNQLNSSDDGVELRGRGILYCPDFLINAGGIIDVHYQRQEADSTQKRAHIGRIENSLLQVLRRSDETGLPSEAIAESLARELLKQGASAGSMAA